MRVWRSAFLLLLPALAQAFSASGGANFSKICPGSDGHVIDAGIGYVTRLSAGPSFTR